MHDHDKKHDSKDPTSAKTLDQKSLERMRAIYQISPHSMYLGDELVNLIQLKSDAKIQEKVATLFADIPSDELKHFLSYSSESCRTFFDDMWSRNYILNGLGVLAYSLPSKSFETMLSKLPDWDFNNALKVVKSSPGVLPHDPSWPNHIIMQNQSSDVIRHLFNKGNPFFVFKLPISMYRFFDDNKQLTKAQHSELTQTYTNNYNCIVHPKWSMRNQPGVLSKFVNDRVFPPSKDFVRQLDDWHQLLQNAFSTPIKDGTHKNALLILKGYVDEEFSKKMAKEKKEAKGSHVEAWSKVTSVKDTNIDIKLILTLTDALYVKSKDFSPALSESQCKLRALHFLFQNKENEEAKMFFNNRIVDNSKEMESKYGRHNPDNITLTLDDYFISIRPLLNQMLEEKEIKKQLEKNTHGSTLIHFLQQSPPSEEPRLSHYYQSFEQFFKSNDVNKFIKSLEKSSDVSAQRTAVVLQDIALVSRDILAMRPKPAAEKTASVSSSAAISLLMPGACIKEADHKHQANVAAVSTNTEAPPKSLEAKKKEDVKSDHSEAASRLPQPK